MLDICDLVNVTGTSIIRVARKDIWQRDDSTFLYKADFKIQVR